MRARVVLLLVAPFPNGEGKWNRFGSKTDMWPGDSVALLRLVADDERGAPMLTKPSALEGGGRVCGEGGG